jgi:DnaK suppressor protein
VSKTPAPKPAPAKTALKAAKGAAKSEAPAPEAESAGVATLEAAATSSSHTGGSRFTDRFAPPKPPTRSMSTPVIETSKSAVKADPKLANAWKTKSGHELTDAEVLAMPESEYMNDKQIEFFRAKLNELKDGLLSNAGETTEHLREDTSIVPDPADRATIEEEHALELRTRDRERKLLKKIMQSLARLDNGEYGYCDETGEPIGLGRLIARPTATLSLEAQQRRELKQKMFGD